MGKQWMAVFVVCCVGGLAACADDSPRASQCQRICEKRELCDSTTDEMDCVDGCRSQTYLSDAFVKQWAQCVAPSNVSCDAAMDDEAVDDCVTDALRAEEPSELLEDVCQALATKLAACEDADASAVQSNCMRGDSLKLGEDYLLESRECVDGLCDDLPGCFDDLADDYDTTLSILPAGAFDPDEGSEPADDEGIERSDAAADPVAADAGLPEGGSFVEDAAARFAADASR